MIAIINYNCRCFNDGQENKAVAPLTLIILGFSFLLLNAALIRLATYVYQVLGLYSEMPSINIQNLSAEKITDSSRSLNNTITKQIDFDPLAIKIISLVISTLTVTPQAIKQITTDPSSLTSSSQLEQSFFL